MFVRIIGIIALIWLVIFIFARISTRKGEKYSPEKAQSKVVDEAGSPEKKETDPYKAAMGHVKAISASLYQICCMDIRNAGMRVLRIAKDMLREKYEGKKECKGYAQFERYYLPTLRKTVDNYSRMEEKDMTDLKIRADMMSYLQSCEEAFSKLYASMFSDDILNMEVQMEAMNITMKRDGLL
ncbi:MAG: hypothetical protein E7233_02850 [Lachnospiraceae bacterium]|nr:hypothetical protein [Lachnospiraceae bacterium]